MARPPAETEAELIHPSNTLLLPGWQTLWEARHGFVRAEQHDWMRPLRGDWNARLEEVVLSRSGPVLLVAHSLGCLLCAAWAAHSRHTSRVQGALLVAPPDLERPDLQTLLPSWIPLERRPLPFPAIVVASSDDPYGALERSQALAQAWGARFESAGARGHLNADSGLGDWPAGLAWLQALAGG